MASVTGFPGSRSSRSPGSEIQGIDTIDVEAGYWSFWDFYYGFQVIPTRKVVTYPDVTVVLVPKPFYDRRILVDSLFLQAPAGRRTSFRKGALVQMACTTSSCRSNHGRCAKRSKRAGSHFATDPGADRVPASQWDGAMRRTLRSPPARADRADVGVVAMGENPKAMSPVGGGGSSVLLIGIAVMLANLTGLWDLPGQDKVREVRTKARAEQKDWADSIRRNREESRKLEAEQKELRRQLDEDMRRMFSR